MRKSELKAIIIECLNERAPKRRVQRTPEDQVVRTNTIRGRQDKLASRERNNFANKSNKQKKQTMKSDAYYGTRGLGPQTAPSDVFDKSGKHSTYRPKSSFKKSGVGR